MAKRKKLTDWKAVAAVISAIAMLMKEAWPYVEGLLK